LLSLGSKVISISHVGWGSFITSTYAGFKQNGLSKQFVVHESLGAVNLWMLRVIHHTSDCTHLA